MYTTPPKKLSIIYILEILQRHSDENHRLTQKQIGDLLRSEYGLEIDRKAISRNLCDLIDAGYPLDYTERLRDNKGDAGSMMTDLYYVHDFTDAELHLLIDSVLFSRHIPWRQCDDLVGKLERLSSKHFRSHSRHVRPLDDRFSPNAQLFTTIEVLDEAISKGRQVMFTYNEYGTDLKLHPRIAEDGAPRRYIINPYQIAATNGRYYLICNYDKYDNVANYRIDRITDITLLDTPVKPLQQVKGLENGLNLPRHMAEHVYMYTGASAQVTFRAARTLLNEIIDWFGSEVSFSNETADAVTVRVRVNLMAMRFWALQYARQICILAPTDLAEAVKSDLREALAQYSI